MEVLGIHGQVEMDLNIWKDKAHPLERPLEPLGKFKKRELKVFVCLVSYGALGEGEAADHQQPRDHAWDIWNSFTTPGID